jgi:hypothetical protein
VTSEKRFNSYKKDKKKMTGILNPMVNSTIFLTMKCDQKLYIVLRICSFYLSERTTL